MIKSYKKALILVISVLFLTHMTVSGKTLTAKDIENWISVEPAVEAWAEENMEDEDEEEFDIENMEDFTMPEGSIDEMIKKEMEELKNHPSYGEIEKLVKKGGFKSGNEYLEVSLDISRAYLAYTMGEELGGTTPADVKAHLDNQLADKNMQPFEKQMIQSQYDAILNMATATLSMFADIPEENIEIVKQYLPKLAPIIEGEDDEDDWGDDW